MTPPKFRVEPAHTRRAVIRPETRPCLNALTNLNLSFQAAAASKPGTPGAKPGVKPGTSLIKKPVTAPKVKLNPEYIFFLFISGQPDKRC